MNLNIPNPIEFGQAQPFLSPAQNIASHRTRSFGFPRQSGKSTYIAKNIREGDAIFFPNIRMATNFTDMYMRVHDLPRPDKSHVILTPRMQLPLTREMYDKITTGVFWLDEVILSYETAHIIQHIAEVTKIGVENVKVISLYTPSL